MPLRPAFSRLTVLPVLLVALATGCSSSDTSTASSSGAASAAPSATTDVSVSGGVGDKPTLTVPEDAAPTQLVTEVLTTGSGDVVGKGDLLVADYLGQTWEPKDGEVNVFDNSYDRGQPAAFPIGVGRVIEGWDAGLVGQKIGSRVLLSVPPAQAYGTDPAGHELGGQTLLFVVDLLDSYPATAAADGTPVTEMPDGFPTVSSESGNEPSITSVEGISAPKQNRSTLLLDGAGEAIASDKTLVLQVVQTDVATGTKTQKTWGGAGLESAPASGVIELAPVLKGRKVGSRALVVTADTGNGSAVLVVDVVGQF